jgi:hypothetical protein
MKWALVFILVIPLCTAFNFEVDEKIYNNEEFEVKVKSNDSEIYDVKIDVLGELHWTS